MEVVSGVFGLVQCEVHPFGRSVTRFQERGRGLCRRPRNRSGGRCVFPGLAGFDHQSQRACVLPWRVRWMMPGAGWPGGWGDGSVIGVPRSLVRTVVSRHQVAGSLARPNRSSNLRFCKHPLASNSLQSLNRSSEPEPWRAAATSPTTNRADPDRGYAPYPSIGEDRRLQAELPTMERGFLNEVLFAANEGLSKM